MAANRAGSAEVVERQISRVERLAAVDPAAAVGLAEEVVELANGEPTLERKARSALGSALREAGRAAEALPIYRDLLAAEDQIPRLERAYVLRRYSAALRCAGELAEALVVAERVLELHIGMRSGVGRGLVIRGAALLELGRYVAATDDYLAALRDLSPTRDSGFWLSALAGLAVCAARHHRPAELGYMRAALRRLAKASNVPLWSVPGLRIRWIDALLCRRLGLGRHAERELLRARDGFLEMGLARDAALANLDLATWALEEGEIVTARDLAVETLAILSAEGAAAEEGLAVLRVVVEGGNLEGKALDVVRAALAGWVARTEA